MNTSASWKVPPMDGVPHAVLLEDNGTRYLIPVAAHPFSDGGVVLFAPGAEHVVSLNKATVDLIKAITS